MPDTIRLLWWLLVFHALCDFPLQGDFLAAGKNHRTPLPAINCGICLMAHALIHGGAVAMLTGSLALGVAETLAHALIDHGKCSGRYGFAADQGLHVGTKLVWCLLA